MNNNKALTPIQFYIARALARAFGHLWSSVPDGTYNVDDIEAYSNELRAPDKFLGICSPTLESVSSPDNEQEGYSYDVVHTTYTGRLTWRVTAGGNVQLVVTRPIDVQVANIWLLKENYYGRQEFFLSTGNKELSDKLEATYDYNVHTELLFKRHVDALVRPIVAVLTVLEQDNYDENYRNLNYHQVQLQIRYGELHGGVIAPAITVAKAMLSPLYAVAKEDPIFD